MNTIIREQPTKHLILLYKKKKATYFAYTRMNWFS